MTAHQVNKKSIQSPPPLFCFLDVKTSDTPLLFQSTSLPAKESNETETPPPLNTNKRPQSEENTESIYTSEIDEQLSPSKRARRSVSSQESFETFR